ncbi:MAG: hypothetical protein EON59_10785 [Alphaproteobacteria bacterium]|nr:MAG: hypothetical protein EON59_10785 [Alphaproteobacteria bacterium]
MTDINDVLNDETWVERSLSAEDLTPEFSFLLGRTVYVGDPNSSEQFHCETYNLPIVLPELAARDPLRPSAREALGREADLAAYYFEIMEKTGRTPGVDGVGFWLSLEFVSDALGERVEFPWWDRISETSNLLDWIRVTDAEDVGFFDCDQGWLFKAERRGGWLHFQHGDLDTGEMYANLKVDQVAFRGRLDQAESDVRTVVGRLKDRLQVDPWS